MGVTATYRIDILSEAGGPVITPWKMGADPCQLKTLGAERDENKTVIGSELTFEFVLQKRIGEANYDALFQSEYREHIVKYYNDDTSTLLWQGYLQPENMYKSIFESNLHIYCSATDALKDLADFKFLNGDDLITGHVSGLQILKYCLANLDTGSQFQYNFIVKLGTKHAGQGANDTALKDVTHDTRRFYRLSDGKTEIDDCLTVIEKILKSYSCTLQQWGGKYYILSKHEAATNYYTYNWALAFVSKAASSDSITIDNYKFSRDADKSYLPPIKEATVRLLNRNIGDCLVANINDYDGGAWDYSNYTGAYDDTQAVMELTAEAGIAPVDNGYVTLAADEAIQKLTEGDYLKITFKYRTITPTLGSNNPHFRIIAVKDGVDYPGLDYIITEAWATYESEVSAAFKLIGGVGDTYDYNFKLQVYSEDGLTDFELELYDFNFTRVVYIEEDSQEDVTFDSFYRGTITQGKQIRETEDLYFGDSPTTGDFAGLIYAAAQTDEWNREGSADAQSLIWCWLKNYLISRQNYTEYVICNIKDSGDNITPINYIIWNGKKYHIVSYDKSWRRSWISLHLKEWITDDIAIGYEAIPLTSIDGESAAGTSTILSATPFTDHNSSTGKQGGAVGQYYHLDAADYTELHNWLDNVTLGADGSTTLVGVTTINGSVNEFITVNATGTPHALVINRTDAGNVHLSFTNPTTGTGLASGTDIGIEADGTARIRQQENMPLEFYTNNLHRWTILANGNLVSELAGAGTEGITTAGVIRAGSLIVDDLTDGYIPYQVAATDKLGNSPIFTDGTNIGINNASPSKRFVIGDSTSVDQQPLVVWGVSQAFSTTQGTLAINSTTAQAADLGGSIVFGGNDGTLTDRTFAAIAGRKENSTNGNYDGYFAIATRSNGGVPTEKFRITSGGNVGILTTTPTVSLQVAGTGIKSETVQSITTYSTGFFGDGYKIIETGGKTTAEFDNLIVRNLLKAFTFEVDKIDVVGGSLVISPASGTAYSVAGNIGEYRTWHNTAYETFVSSGLDLTSVINSGGGGGLANIVEMYEAIAGETITIVGNITLNSGTLPVIRIYEDGGASSYDYALAAGANTINHTVIDDSDPIEITLLSGIGVDCNFSMSGVAITSDIPRIVFDTNNNTNPIQFVVGDYIAAQTWKAYDHTVVDSYRAHVTKVVQSATLGNAYIQVEAETGTAWTGMKLAQFGSSSDAARRNLLYLTSSDTNNPFVEGHSGVTDGTFSATTRKFRLGNLTGITDPVLGALSGFGIYTQHGYFTGISAFGTLAGLDPETVDTNNVSIVGCQIYEGTRNDDTGSLYINSIGYQGGATKYRNTYIGDGKYGYLLQGIGSAGTISIMKSFSFVPYTFANDLTPSTITNVLFIFAGPGAAKTLTLPVAADVVTQFGAGKSGTNPICIVINTDATYNLNITTVGNADTFWYSGSNTKTYVLAPHRSIIMTFAENEWYVTET